MIFDWTFGLALIAAGIVLGPVPVLQGWILVLAGLAILSSHNRWARVVYERVKAFGRKILRPRTEGESDEGGR